jgi:hypothetical protein
MKSKFTQQRIDFVRLYVEKHVDPNSSIPEVVTELCDESSKILEDNALLRENIFNLEQVVEPERRWENILAAKLARAVQENNKEDYLELTNSINNDIWIITIQKKFGKSPEQLRQQSEIRRLKSVNKVMHLLRDNKQMQRKLAELSFELQTLKFIKKNLSNPEEELKTRQEIEMAIKLVNNYIAQFNTQFYRREIGKLTSSMRESFHEAWIRSAESMWKVQSLEKKIKELRLQFNEKGVVASKFGKYRKRGKRK